jgi:hypothetical protein
MPKEQRRGRRIAMSTEELDAFLGSERTCRAATVRGDGRPHVTPLWFVWDGSSLWLNSIVKSQRWTDIAGNPALSVVIDAGGPYDELRGVELSGSVTVVGDAPRTAGPGDPRLAGPERLWAEKYSGTTTYVPDGRHAWLRLEPDKIVSWDFRRLATL